LDKIYRIKQNSILKILFILSKTALTFACRAVALAEAGGFPIPKKVENNC